MPEISIFIALSCFVYFLFIFKKLKNEKEAILQENVKLKFEINKTKEEVISKSKTIEESKGRITSIKNSCEAKIADKVSEYETKVLKLQDDLSELSKLKESLNFYKSSYESLKYIKVEFNDLKRENESLRERLIQSGKTNRENIQSISYYMEKLEENSNKDKNYVRKINNLKDELKTIKKENDLIKKTKLFERFSSTYLDISINEIENIKKEIIIDHEKYLSVLNNRTQNSPDEVKENIKHLSEKTTSLLKSGNYLFGYDLTLDEYLNEYKKFSKYNKQILRLIETKNHLAAQEKLLQFLNDFPNQNYDTILYTFPDESLSQSYLKKINRVFINESYIYFIFSQLRLALKYIFPKKPSLIFGFSENNPNYIKGLLGEIYCKNYLDDKKIEYVNSDRFNLDFLGFSYRRISSHYFDYQHSDRFDLEKETFLNLVHQCSESNTCLYGKIRPCNTKVIDFDLQAYIGNIQSHCSRNLIKFVNITDIEANEKQKEKFILINSKVSKFFITIKNNPLEDFLELSKMCASNGSLGRIDFFCMDDEPYCMEVKVNSSRLSLTQEFRLGVLSYFGFKSKIFKVKMKEFDFEELVNCLDNKGISDTLDYLETSHEIIDYIPSDKVKNYIQKNIVKIIDSSNRDIDSCSNI